MMCCASLTLGGLLEEFPDLKFCRGRHGRRLGLAVPGTPPFWRSGAPYGSEDSRKRSSCLCSFRIRGGIATEAPNKDIAATSSSVRPCHAPALVAARIEAKR